MFGTQVLDKDGISAGAIISEMASFLHSNGLSVSQKLQELYVKYAHDIKYSFNVLLRYVPATPEAMMQEKLKLKLTTFREIFILHYTLLLLKKTGFYHSQVLPLY